MNEFNKWYKNSGSAWSFPTNSTNEPKFKAGWKAALEWVNNECEFLDDVCCLDCGCFSMVQNKIDEELKEE